MPAELLDRVRESVFHACESIIRRNMGPHYTNIAIMGSFVTLLAGEVFQNPRYLDYGLQKFEAFHQYASRTRTFQEYNSPTYTKVAIIELSRIRSATRIGRALEICEDMLNLAWDGVARHFHASTGQWAGPHSRCYSTLLPDAARAFLQLALEGELDFVLQRICSTIWNGTTLVFPVPNPTAPCSGKPLKGKYARCITAVKTAMKKPLLLT